MKRIMILTNSLTGGGAERSMNLVCNELTLRGWPVSLVPINSSETDLIVPTCEVFPLNRKWQGGIVDTLSALRKFHAISRSWKPDVVILNCDLPELFGALLLKKNKRVVVEHSNPAWTTRMNFGKIVRRILRIQAATWVSVSSHIQIWPSGLEPYAVLQNPLPSSTEVIQDIGTTSHLQRLVYIGRLASVQKRPEWMLKIGALTGIEVLMIGEGSIMQALRNEARIIHPGTDFAGYVRDAWSLVQSGDLLIVPSAWEGDGLVVIEGLKRGIPMLLSDIPDFQRFDLPSKNYCQNVDDFVARINIYRENLTSLVVPEDVKDSILSLRSLDAVGDAWEIFLNSI